MPRDDDNAGYMKNPPKWIPPRPPKPAGPTWRPAAGPPKPPKKRVFEDEPLPPDERPTYQPPAWNTGFNNNFQNEWSNPQPAAPVANPFLKLVPAWNSLWNPPKQNIAIPPSFAWTQPKPATIGGYQPQGSAPFYAAIENQKNQELINIAPNIPQADISAQQAAMRGRTAAVQGPTYPPPVWNTGNGRTKGTVKIAKGGGVMPVTTPVYSGGGTTNKKNGKGGGGYGGYSGGGYSYDTKAYSSDRVPSWLMSLYNWQFKG